MKISTHVSTNVISTFINLRTIFTDGQEISHAVDMTKQASPNVYTNDFKKEVLGKAPANPSIAYPEQDRLKKHAKITSKVRH